MGHLVSNCNPTEAVACLHARKIISNALMLLSNSFELVIEPQRRPDSRVTRLDFKDFEMQNQLHLSRFKEQAKKIKASLMRSIPSENLEDAKLLQVQEALAHAYGFRNRHEALQAAERQHTEYQQTKAAAQPASSSDAAVLVSHDEEPDPSCAFNAAINYALKCGTGDGGLEFLACWREGNFSAIRREWPDAPDAVFKGADPLYGKN